MKKVALAITLCSILLLSVACVSGGLSTPSAFLCSSAGSLQAVCATPGEKPRSLAKVCKKSVVIPLVCGPSPSAPPPAVCPPVIPTGCTSGLLASLTGRFMSSSEKGLLSECAPYLGQVQQCAMTAQQ